jgi:hypothetical protein
VLRLVHVVTGALWVGMMAFSAFYLMPAVQEVGLDGGKVMAAIQKRGLMTVMPLLALGALISGIWLYIRAAAGMPAEFGRSPVGWRWDWEASRRWRPGCWASRWCVPR